MEGRPWRGIGGFINVPAQNERSGGLGWTDTSAGQYSVIPSSILAQLSKWPSCLAGLFPRFCFDVKVPLLCLLARACLPVPASPLGAAYASPSPNFRAFLTCRAPENRKSRPEAFLGSLSQQPLSATS